MAVFVRRQVFVGEMYNHLKRYPSSCLGCPDSSGCSSGATSLILGETQPAVAHRWKHTGRQQTASNSTLRVALALLTHIFREEDDKERSDQVINSLDIPTGGVPDGPDKENSFKDLGRGEGKGS